MAIYDIGLAISLKVGVNIDTSLIATHAFLVIRVHIPVLSIGLSKASVMTID